MTKLIRNIFIILGIVLLLSVVANTFRTQTEIKQVPVTEITNLAKDGKIKSLVVDGDKVTASIKDSDTKLEATFISNSDISTFLKDNGVESDKIRDANIEYKASSGWSSFAGGILPFVVPFLLLSIFVYFLLRQVQGSNNKALTFGQSTVRLSDERKNRVRFADVAGSKEAKEELNEVVEFLKYPQKFLELGAKIPKGVLLLGSPGVGKTLLARAVAGEANVPFFHISGSEFVEMFVGVGASRVRDMFKKAKKNSPCIIFIDEIDAVGRQRGTGLGGGHDEREQTLNQILVEMDGFESDTNVIVLAATNRADVLDPALLRPGRFDRRVILDLPDIHDRAEILAVHAKNKPLAKDVDLKKIAARTVGFSGADLANLLNEGAILTARVNKKEIGNEQLKEAVEKVILGPSRQSHLLSDREKKITAYHEGGHALVASVLPHADAVHKVTILSRGRAAGYTMTPPAEDKLQTKSSFLDEIAVSLGGYAAEELVFNEMTTGASSDMKSATAKARAMVTMYGMSPDVGPVVLNDSQENVFIGRGMSDHRNYSEDMAKRVDQEVERIMKDGLVRAREVLTSNRKYLDEIAQRLVKDETLEQEEFEKIVADVIPASKKSNPEPTLS